MKSLERSVLLASRLLGGAFLANAAPAESAAEAPGPAGPLRGSLLAPDSGSVAAVLIIPGSGPTDRDGNSPLGIKASTYRLLAEGLASRGVTTLRIDKRGLFGSAAATPDANAVTIADDGDDVHACMAVLRKKTGAPCVWLLVHGEGGLVAMAAANEGADPCRRRIDKPTWRPTRTPHCRWRLVSSTPSRDSWPTLRSWPGTEPGQAAAGSS